MGDTVEVRKRQRYEFREIQCDLTIMRIVIRWDEGEAEGQERRQER